MEYDCLVNIVKPIMPVYNFIKYTVYFIAVIICYGLGVFL